jgi:hypothetical protein
MPCRRCSTCGINYPVGVWRCRLCAEKLDYINNEDPDADWEYDVQLARVESSGANMEHANVVAWRDCELVRAGYPLDIARALAEHEDIDLHKAVDMLNHGCPAELALSILL